MSNLLEILYNLPTGDYIRIRDDRHEYIGRSNAELNVILIPGSLDWASWENFVMDKVIREGDTLYDIKDINSVQVKPLIYL